MEVHFQNNPLYLIADDNDKIIIAKKFEENYKYESTINKLNTDEEFIHYVFEKMLRRISFWILFLIYKEWPDIIPNKFNAGYKKRFNFSFLAEFPNEKITEDDIDEACQLFASFFSFEDALSLFYIELDYLVRLYLKEKYENANVMAHVINLMPRKMGRKVARFWKKERNRRHLQLDYDVPSYDIQNHKIHKWLLKDWRDLGLEKDLVQSEKDRIFKNLFK